MIELLIEVLPVFAQMIVLFLILILGYIGGKTKVLTVKDNKPLSKMVNCITNPCSVLHSALCVERAVANDEVLKLIGITVIMYFGLILIAELTTKVLRVKVDQQGQYKFMMVFSNVGYMGIPVVQAIFGEEATFCVAIFIMVFYLFIYTYGVRNICNEPGKKGFDWKKMICPMTICSLLAIIGYLCGLQFGVGVPDNSFDVGVIIRKTLKTVANITTPCAMLIIGCALSSVPIKKVFGNWRLYVVAVLKLLVIPVVVYLLLKPIMGASMVLGVMVVIMAMPVATIITMLSAQYDKDQTLAASSVFITTLLSVVTIPLLAAILKAG